MGLTFVFKKHFTTCYNSVRLQIILREHIPFSGRLNFPATNNATENEACTMGLQAALGLGVKELEVYGDSTLIIA